MFGRKLILISKSVFESARTMRSVTWGKFSETEVMIEICKESAAKVVGAVSKADKQRRVLVIWLLLI
jgi:hypothetical protein